MEKVTAAALALVLCSCGNVEGLRSEDIYGLSARPEVWLYGLVTNARTGAPMADVSIQVEGHSTASDVNGAYRVEGLEAAGVTGSASATGFQAVTLVLELKAGANSHDIALQPQECGTCPSGQFCDDAQGVCVGPATLSGGIVNACDGTGIDARITIDGKSTCSSSRSGKAYFQIVNIRPGGPQVIAVGKPGFVPHNGQLTLQPGLNAIENIGLTPVGGCSVSPALMPCTCTDVSCQ